MVIFEKMLFNYNEYMHYSGILTEDAYIDGFHLIMQGFEALIIMMLYIHYVLPVALEKVMNIRVSETTVTNIFIGVVLSFLILFYLEHAYGILLLFSITLVSLYFIFTDKRLIRVREFIEQLF